MEAERGVGTYAIGDFCDHRAVDDTVVQEISQLRNGIGFLVKQFTIVNSEKVNAVGLQGATSITYKSDLKEQA